MSLAQAAVNGALDVQADETKCEGQAAADHPRLDPDCAICGANIRHLRAEQGPGLQAVLAVEVAMTAPDTLAPGPAETAADSSIVGLEPAADKRVPLVHKAAAQHTPAPVERNTPDEGSNMGTDSRGNSTGRLDRRDKQARFRPRRRWESRCQFELLLPAPTSTREPRWQARYPRTKPFWPA